MNYEFKMNPYIGNENQLISCEHSVLKGGLQEGVESIHIHNGGHLSSVILPDRGMDIYQIRYKGKNINYLAPNGIVSSKYYDSDGIQFLRNFYVGFMTTCGLRNIGKPVDFEDDKRGLHGRISNTPAENVLIERRVADNNPTLSIEGTMREARLFGENLRLNRKYLFVYEKDQIEITDTISNYGFGEEPYMYGLHINFGYPLLEPSSKIIFNTKSTDPRDEHAAQFIDTWNQIEEPDYPYQERCYFHDLVSDSNDQNEYVVFNPNLNIGVRVQFKKSNFPYFTQWKMLGKGEYVLGLEPMNSYLDGPKIGEPGCKAPVLKPGKSEKIVYTFSFLDEFNV